MYLFFNVIYKVIFNIHLPKPKVEPRSPALQMDSLPAELSGTPKNTKVVSLSFPQHIFLI